MAECSFRLIVNRTCVKWEIRFIRYFVNRFKGSETIVAWEPGNETNVMLGVEFVDIKRDEYYVWLSTLVNTIKSCDPTRPVIAYSGFVLAKQAGIELQFAQADQELPVSNIYMLPSVTGEIPLPLRTQKELLRRVKEDGAILYISWDGALLSGFPDMMGAEMVANRERQQEQTVAVPAINEKMPMQGNRKLVLQPVTAEVLATEENGDPALLCNAYGKGKIYFLGFGLEQKLCSQSGAFEKPYYKLYEYLFKAEVHSIVAQKKDPLLGITEHPLPEGGWAVAVINYGTKPIEEILTLKTGCSFCNACAGKVSSAAPGTVKVSLTAGDMCIFTVKE